MNDHIWKQAYFLWLQLPALFTHRCNRKSHGHWLDFVLSHALVYKIQACTAELAYECFFFFPCWAVMAELTDVAIFLKHYNHPVAFNSSLPLFFSFSFFSENVLLSSSTFVSRKVNGDTKDDTAEALLSLLLQNISKDVHSLQLSSLGRYLFQF